MDLFVLTSNTEGLPNAVMEAMAAGLPCVVTDAGGSREVVHNGETGFVVPIGDLDRLSKRIGTLLGDDGLRRRMGLKGRESMMAFDCHRMAEQYQRLYAGVLGRREVTA
jgi:glycosyltransferase involved in cell wall biosynthesis